jgi:hypothetical protein
MHQIVICLYNGHASQDWRDASLHSRLTQASSRVTMLAKLHVVAIFSASLLLVPALTGCRCLQVWGNYVCVVSAWRMTLKPYPRDTVKLAAHSQYCMGSLMREETVNATAVTSSSSSSGCTACKAQYSKWSWAVAENFGNRRLQLADM